MRRTLLLLPLLLLPQNALAQGVKPNAGAFFFYKGKINKEVLRFTKKLQGALAYSPTISYKPMNLPTPGDHSEEIDKGLALLKEGNALGKEAKLEEGIAKYHQALQLFDKYLYSLTLFKPYPKNKKRYRGLFKRMAIFAYHMGDKKAAKRYMTRYFSFRYKDKEEKWPKPLRPLWRATNPPYKAKGKALLTITTTPPGAKIYYKFKDKGPSPLVKRCPAGEILLLVTHRGYAPGIKRFMMDPSQGPQSTHITLTPLPGTPLTSLLAAEQELSQTVPGPNILKAASLLGVEVILFYSIEAKSAKEVTVTASLFDPRVKKRLNQLNKTFDVTTTPPEALKHFVASLFKGVSLDGTIAKATAVDGTTTPFTFSTLMKKRYFWPVVGGIGGALLIGTAATLLLLTQHSPDRPRGGHAAVFK